MNSKSMGLKLILVILIAAILAGCNTAATTVAPTMASTSDQKATLDYLRTEVAQTIIANPTQVPPTETQVLETNTPTVTSTPTATITPLPTSTPLPPTLTPTKTLVPWTSTPVYTSTPVSTATLTTFNCTITSVKPTDTVKKGSDFDANWVVKNTGTETWIHTEVDIKYISGTKMQKAGEDLLDMKSDVAHDGSYTVIVDMIAPSTAGTYTATWALQMGSTRVCTMPLTVVVVN